MPSGRRRRIAWGALALVAVISFSAASQSQPVQILQLGLQLVAAITSAVDGGDAVRWKKETTAKLDTLINLTPKMIDDLKQLRIDVSKTVATSFSAFVENMLKADVKQFEVNLAELKEYQQQNEDSRTRINQLTHNIERDVYTSAEYGPAVYQTTFTAVVILRAVYKFTNVPRAHQTAFFATMADKYTDWLKPVEGNPAYVKNEEQGKREQAQSSISHIVGPGSLDFTDWGCVWTTVAISGDPKNGFQTTAKWNSTCGLKLRVLESRSIAERHRNEIQKQLDDARAEFLMRDRNVANIDEVIQQITRYRNALREAAQGRPLS
ncbi:MAG: hypothetical protein ACLPKB_07475 [Xanthobacteraceae bacterium]